MAHLQVQERKQLDDVPTFSLSFVRFQYPIRHYLSELNHKHQFRGYTHQSNVHFNGSNAHSEFHLSKQSLKHDQSYQNHFKSLLSSEHLKGL